MAMAHNTAEAQSSPVLSRLCAPSPHSASINQRRTITSSRYLGSVAMVAAAVVCVVVAMPSNGLAVIASAAAEESAGQGEGGICNGAVGTEGGSLSSLFAASSHAGDCAESTEARPMSDATVVGPIPISYTNERRHHHFRTLGSGGKGGGGGGAPQKNSAAAGGDNDHETIVMSFVNDGLDGPYFNYQLGVEMAADDESDDKAIVGGGHVKRVVARWDHHHRAPKKKGSGTSGGLLLSSVGPSFVHGDAYIALDVGGHASGGSSSNNKRGSQRMSYRKNSHVTPSLSGSGGEGNKAACLPKLMKSSRAVTDMDLAIYSSGDAANGEGQQRRKKGNNKSRDEAAATATVQRLHAMMANIAAITDRYNEHERSAKGASVPSALRQFTEERLVDLHQGVATPFPHRTAKGSRLASVSMAMADAVANAHAAREEALAVRRRAVEAAEALAEEEQERLEAKAFAESRVQLAEADARRKAEANSTAAKSDGGREAYEREVRLRDVDAADALQQAVRGEEEALAKGSDAAPAKKKKAAPSPLAVAAASLRAAFEEEERRVYATAAAAATATAADDGSTTMLARNGTVSHNGTTNVPAVVVDGFSTDDLVFLWNIVKGVERSVSEYLFCPRPAASPLESVGPLCTSDAERAAAHRRGARLLYVAVPSFYSAISGVRAHGGVHHHRRHEDDDRDAIYWPLRVDGTANSAHAITTVLFLDTWDGPNHFEADHVAAHHSHEGHAHDDFNRPFWGGSYELGDPYALDPSATEHPSHLSVEPRRGRLLMFTSGRENLFYRTRVVGSGHYADGGKDGDQQQPPPPLLRTLGMSFTCDKAASGGLKVGPSYYESGLFKVLETAMRHDPSAHARLRDLTAAAAAEEQRRGEQKGAGGDVDPDVYLDGEADDSEGSPKYRTFIRPLSEEGDANAGDDAAMAAGDIRLTDEGGV